LERDRRRVVAPDQSPRPRSRMAWGGLAEFQKGAGLAKNICIVRGSIISIEAWDYRISCPAPTACLVPRNMCCGRGRGGRHTCVSPLSWLRKQMGPKLLLLSRREGPRAFSSDKENPAFQCARLGIALSDGARVGAGKDTRLRQMPKTSMLPGVT